MQTETTPRTNPTTQSPSADARATRESLLITPALDVYQSEAGALVAIDLPGVPTNGLDLSIEKDRLTVTAKRATARYDVTYARTLVLPREVDGARIDATLENGVLTLTLPRLESARPRQIQVKTG